MITSPGCCRLGEYGKCIENALRDLGYEAKYLELQLYDGIKRYVQLLKTASGKIIRLYLPKLLLLQF